MLPTPSLESLPTDCASDTHSTHSQKSSSVAVPISVVFDGAPIPSNPQEMLSEIRRLELQCSLLEKQILKDRAAAKAREKEAQKAAQEVQRQAQMQEAIRTRVFTGPFSSYKRKYDLIVLASALGLRPTGTVAELQRAIKSHLTLHPEIQSESRFSGLYSQSKRRRMDNSP